MGISVVLGMRQVGYDEAVESEAGTDDDVCEPPEIPKLPLPVAVGDPLSVPSPRSFAFIDGVRLHENYW